MFYFYYRFLFMILMVVLGAWLGYSWRADLWGGLIGGTLGWLSWQLLNALVGGILFFFIYNFRRVD